MIEVNRGSPSQGRMAGIAVIGGENVIRGLRRRAHCGANTVTRRAFMRRAFEDHVDVARFARQVAMLADQLKASG